MRAINNRTYFIARVKVNKKKEQMKKLDTKRVNEFVYVKASLILHICVLSF